MNKAEEFLKEHNWQLGEDADGNILMISDDLHLFQDIVKVMEQYAQQEKTELFDELIRYADIMSDLSTKTALYYKIIKLKANHQNQEDETAFKRNT